jgi:hypothetical protein
MGYLVINYYLENIQEQMVSMSRSPCFNVKTQLRRYRSVSKGILLVIEVYFDFIHFGSDEFSSKILFIH